MLELSNKLLAQFVFFGTFTFTLFHPGGSAIAGFAVASAILGAIAYLEGAVKGEDEKLLSQIKDLSDRVEALTIAKGLRRG